MLEDNSESLPHLFYLIEIYLLRCLFFLIEVDLQSIFYDSIIEIKFTYYTMYPFYISAQFNGF